MRVLMRTLTVAQALVLLVSLYWPNWDLARSALIGGAATGAVWLLYHFTE